MKEQSVLCTVKRVELEIIDEFYRTDFWINMSKILQG